MKIGDEVFVHGYVDEIRKDVVIIRNDGGYFGTIKDELASQPVQKWIPCSERLPEADTEVLIYLWGSPYIAWVEYGRWRTEEFDIQDHEEPKAWMPLPEPWKGAEDEAKG